MRPRLRSEQDVWRRQRGARPGLQLRDRVQVARVAVRQPLHTLHALEALGPLAALGPLGPVGPLEAVCPLGALGPLRALGAVGPVGAVGAVGALGAVLAAAVRGGRGRGAAARALQGAVLERGGGQRLRLGAARGPHGRVLVGGRRRRGERAQRHGGCGGARPRGARTE